MSATSNWGETKSVQASKELNMWELDESTWSNALHFISRYLVTLWLGLLKASAQVIYSKSLTVLKSAQRNPLGANLHSEDFLDTQICSLCVAGPFKNLSYDHLQISCFGVIQKCNQLNKWHLIVDLSYLKHHSINNGIRSHLYSF